MQAGHRSLPSSLPCSVLPCATPSCFTVLLYSGRMAYWLLKSEPDCYSFGDLERLGRDHWNGVRNYQARNFLRQMQPGDLCLFYHSSTRPAGVAGVARVVRAAYPDPSQFDPASDFYDPAANPAEPRWTTVDVQAVGPLPQFVPLDAIRELPAWESSLLTRKGNRLSVLPVTPAQFQAVLHAGQATALEL